MTAAPRRTASDRMRRLTLADAACAPLTTVEAAPRLHLPRQHTRQAALLTSIVLPHQRDSVWGCAIRSLPVNPPNQQPDASTSSAVVPLTDTAVSEEPQTTTVTLLPLQHEEKPAFEWSTSLLANEGAGPNARLRARPWLTIGHWPGNVDIAARVADKLVDNAVRHGRPFTDGCVSLHLIVTGDTKELLVEVDDASPEFPEFEKVANLSGEPNGKPTGLWWVAHYRGRLSWDVKRNVDGEVVGKTVQAILPIT